MIRLNAPARAGLVLVLLVGTAAAADTYSPRQYYGPILKNPKLSYSYRLYYYKPAPDYVGYKHHYAIYPQSDSKHVYFYNPYKKQFWGRCPVDAGGRPQYSVLAEQDRRARLSQIPEGAFPPPGGLPPIPGSVDGATLELPPDDLPGGDMPATGK